MTVEYEIHDTTAAALAPPTLAPPCHHTARFFVDDAVALDDAAGVLAAALREGRPVVGLVTPEHRRGLLRRLDHGGIDVDRAIDEHRLLLVDAAEALERCLRDGRPDRAAFRAVVDGLLRQARRSTGPDARITAVGELVMLLCLDGRHDDAIAIESYWNDVLARERLDLYCPYHVRAFSRAEDTAALEAICDAHTIVVPDESYRGTDDEERGRSIALLQHRARLASAESGARSRAEAALRSRERELSQLLEHTLDGIEFLDGDGNVEWANPAMLALLGYPADAVVGHSFADVQLDPEGYAAFWEAIACRTAQGDYPLELRRADGSAVSVVVRTAAQWQGGRLTGVHCFVRDVTEQRRLERQLREQNEALADALAARDEFLLVAAHELKTPITSLRIFAQFLHRDVVRHGTASPERLAPGLEAIERQSAHLAQLVGRLLDTASIDAGELTIETRETDLAGLVRAAVAGQQIAATHRFTVDAPDELCVDLDPVRFEQVVTHLLVNACRFSPRESTIEVALRQEADGSARLSVTDHGVGVPPEQRERIFTRYHHAHRANHLSGLGLGLSITRRIVSLHGGAIWVEEPPHPGSRFVISLPKERVTRTED